MLRVVLDTNTLASGFAGFQKPESSPGRIMRAWVSGQFKLVLSTHILQELERTFGNAYFREQLTTSQVERALALLRAETDVVVITDHIAGIATHPEDDLILATAVAVRADYLVTGDKQLRKIGSYQDVAIISPAEFLSSLLEES